eukprot:gene30448-38057_t
MADEQVDGLDAGSVMYGTTTDLSGRVVAPEGKIANAGTKLERLAPGYRALATGPGRMLADEQVDGLDAGSVMYGTTTDLSGRVVAPEGKIANAGTKLERLAPGYRALATGPGRMLADEQVDGLDAGSVIVMYGTTTDLSGRVVAPEGKIANAGSKLEKLAPGYRALATGPGRMLADEQVDGLDAGSVIYASPAGRSSFSMNYRPLPR